MFWESLRKARKDKAEAEDDVYLNVYSSYEVIYQKLETENPEKFRDVIELLKIFAFFDRENIQV